MADCITYSVTHTLWYVSQTYGYTTEKKGKTKEMSDMLFNKPVQVISEQYREGFMFTCTVVVYNKTRAAI